MSRVLLAGLWLVLGGRLLSGIVPLQVVPGKRAAGFTSVSASEAGVQFTNRVLPERYLTNQIYLNGSGVALGDVNGDHRPDLFLAAPEGRSALFLNQGDWKFQPSPHGLPQALARVDASGAALADLDGDGSLDLVINSVGQGTFLLFNDGKGQFESRGPIINAGRAGMSLGLADVDGDGDLDLYITNYRPVTLRDDPSAKFTVRNEVEGPRVMTYNGRSTSDPDLVGRFYVTPSGVRENGEPDVLFLNDGKGNFTPVSWTAGAFLDESGKPLKSAPHDWGLSVLFRDLNGDGRPDLYVCNDFQSPDRFWINDTPRGGPLRFRAASALTLRHTSAFAMGADAADINRDGIDDFLVLDMLSRDHRLRNLQVDNLPPSRHQPGVFDERAQFSQNTLFLGRADGTFAEVGRLAGLAASEWSWCPIFLDVDLDGWEDLLVSNGHEMDMMDADIIERADQAKNQKRMSTRELLELRKQFPRLATPNAAFRNQGNLRFVDQSTAWGFDLPQVTHGMALADLDGDGDLDVVQNNLNGPPTLLRNEASAPRLAVRVRAQGSNTHGIGTRLTVRGGPVPEQSQVILSGGRYLSSDDSMRVFAAPSATPLTLEVHWPSGRQTTWTNLPANSLVELTEPVDPFSTSPSPVRLESWMEDQSARLNHSALDTPLQDLERQPLLPWNQVYVSPGATWADLDDDGADELILGSGAGGSPAVFQWDASGFRRWTNTPLSKPVLRDMTTLLAIGKTLLVGSSNYRDGRTNGGVLRLYDLERNAAGESLLGQGMGVGPLAMADVDGDGTLEVFVGGRAKAGRYPEASPSLLLKSEGGRFTVRNRFTDVGLVNGATFADLDNDGDPDLILAVEWGSVQILRNQGGNFTAWDPVVRGIGSAPVAMSNLSGWWTSVAVGDFDGDGRLDLVAGNRGWNWFPAPQGAQVSGADPTQRRRLHYGDFSGMGTTELLESYFVQGQEYPVRRADVLFAAMPALREAFPTRSAFGAASLTQVLQGNKGAQPLSVLEARWFATTVFLNRGDHFEVRPLPVEAQFAPVFGVAVGDFDGDGTQDLFLAQNLLSVRSDETPQDAGCGLMMRGDGAGGFVSVPSSESGIAIWGDARAAAVGDFDRDGRADLVVTQNGTQTRLFRNRAARPGLRVQLKGPSDNPRGIGVHLRLLAGSVSGPLQEVQAGTGWLSVDSASRLLTCRGTPTHLEIQWPGKPVTRIPISSSAREVVVTPEGTLRVLK